MCLRLSTIVPWFRRYRTVELLSSAPLIPRLYRGQTIATRHNASRYAICRPDSYRYAGDCLIDDIIRRRFSIIVYHCKYVASRTLALLWNCEKHIIDICMNIWICVEELYHTFTASTFKCRFHVMLYMSVSSRPLEYVRHTWTVVSLIGNTMYC
jgi:hypothetical protein